MSERAGGIISRILEIPGMEVAEQGIITCESITVGEVTIVGDSILIEVRVHQADAPLLIDHYACCTVLPESVKSEEGWLQFMFCNDPTVEEMEAILEAFNSAAVRTEGPPA
jgi:hypothetical protein